ncbi:MAG: hypothetical protein J6G98_01175 [Bacilli bacterium]|nr:hypothetical protein [Bacilli bacterium]
MNFIFTEVKMGKIKCTKEYNEVIGTNSIASCIGVLLYDKLNKKAIVGHFNSNEYGGYEEEDAKRIFECLIYNMKINNFSNDVSYLIVPGIVGNKDRISIVALELENNLSNFEKMNIDNSSIRMHDKTESLEFVFDPINNVFLTDKYYPNDNDYIVDTKKLK